MAKVFKVVERRGDNCLTGVVVKGETAIEYFAGKWVGVPEWLKEEGYCLTCFPFTRDGLRVALDFMRFGTPRFELWLAEGEGLFYPSMYLDTGGRAEGRLVPRGEARYSLTIIAERICLLRRVGVAVVDGFAVALRDEKGQPRNAFSPEDRCTASGICALGSPKPRLQVMFLRRDSAERQVRGAGAYVTEARGLGVILEPFSAWASEKREFQAMVKAWPRGAVQAGRLFLRECKGWS